MTNTSKRLLPLKLNLSMAAAELGLSDFRLTDQLNTLLQYQRDYGLTIKLDGHYRFPAQPASDGLEEVTGDDGHVKLLTNGTTRWMDSATELVELGAFQFSGNSHVVIHSVFVDGVEYFTIDETQMETEALVCSLDELYVDKEDLIDFRDGELREIPTWANAASDQYAPELALAVKIHKALRGEGAYSNKKVMLDRVNNWLEEHMPDDGVGPYQAERIATMIGDASKQPWPKK